MTDFSTIELSLDPNAGELTLHDDGSLIRRSILPGGVRVISEKIPGMQTAAVGFWVGAGSADEVEGTLGSTHFLEHLLFKGTVKRDALKIAETIDYLGGNFNAGTGKQLTYYYGHVVDEDLPDAIELLTDMVTSSVLDANDMEMERGVILEELAMYNDDASEVAHETLASLVFGDHPLGRPIGGTRESVTSLDHSHLRAHYAANYTSNELVVSAAGKINHEELCAIVASKLRAAGWELDEGVAPAPRRFRDPIAYADPSTVAIARPVEQAAVILGMPSMPDTHPSRFALYALSTILGGGTSSRLFQEIREKRGLAYSTYSFPGLYHEGGLFGLYAGCSPDVADEVAGLMGECLEKVARGSVTDAELETAYRRTRADSAFGAESVGSRMNQLGQSEIIRGTLVSRQENMRRSRSVTADQVQQAAQLIATAPRSRVVVGPGA